MERTANNQRLLPNLLMEIKPTAIVGASE